MLTESHPIIHNYTKFTFEVFPDAQLMLGHLSEFFTVGILQHVTSGMAIK